jgi:hypothetical protein
MQDRQIPLSGAPVDAAGAPCSYCSADAGEVAERDQWPAERLAHLYRCRELSTYRIAEVTGLPQLLAELYEVARLSSRQVAAITGLPERTVRDRLRRYGIRARGRGAWNREDRRAVPAQALRRLYVQLGMTAAEVGEVTGTSQHAVLRA